MNMKYAVVHWIETNETSVLEDNCVRDSSMLTEPAKKGMIYYRHPGEKKPPKGGWKAYLGQVLSVHETRKEAVARENDYLDQDKENVLRNEDGNARKRRKANKLISALAASDDENSSEGDGDVALKETTTKVPSIIEKRKLAQRQSNKSLIEDSQHSKSLEDDAEDLQYLPREELIKKIESLEKILCEERDRKQLHKDLPGMLIDAMIDKRVVDRLFQLSKGMVSNSVVNNSGSPSAFGSFKQTSVLPTRPSHGLSAHSAAITTKKPIYANQPGPLTPNVASRLSTPTNLTITPNPKMPPLCSITTPDNETPEINTEFIESGSLPDAKSPEEIKKELCSLLTPVALTEVDRAKKISKLTKTLLAALFDRETLQKSSLAGKKSGEQLDQNKVQIIIAYVSLRFPGAEKQAIRNAISQKIKDERMACKRKIKCALDKCF